MNREKYKIEKILLRNQSSGGGKREFMKKRVTNPILEKPRKEWTAYQYIEERRTTFSKMEKNSLPPSGGEKVSGQGGKGFVGLLREREKNRRNTDVMTPYLQEEKNVYGHRRKRGRTWALILRGGEKKRGTRRKIDP